MRPTLKFLNNINYVVLFCYSCGRFHSTQLYTLYRFVLEHLATAASGEMTTRDAKHSVHKLYINTKDGIKPYRMVIYTSTNVNLCLFFEQQCNEITQQYLEDIGNVLSTQLYILSRDIEDYLSKQTNTTGKSTPASCGGDSDYGTKYLFINDQSLKMITNLGEDDTQRKTKLCQNILNVMADLFTISEGDNKESDMSIPNQEEIMVKSTDDFWVVKRHGNWRQRFVIVFSTKPTLLDMTKEAERIFTEHDIKDGVFSDK